MSKRHRNQAISGAWSGHLIEMLNSTPWRVLSLSARLILDRIEIEHRNHGARENGRLIVTQLQFVKYGLNKKCIAPALRELVALGFSEITEAGEAGLGGNRRPNRFRLTYMPHDTRPGDGTHEWRRYASLTLAEAAKVAATARKATTPAKPASRSKQHLALVA
jgi:hypothetical protein